MDVELDGAKVTSLAEFHAEMSRLLDLLLIRIKELVWSRMYAVP